MRSLDAGVLNRLNKMFLEDPTAQSYVGKSFGDRFIEHYINFVTKLSPLWYSDRASKDGEVRTALGVSITRTALFAEIPNELLSNASIQLRQYVAICTLGLYDLW